MFGFLKWIFGTAQDRLVKSYRKIAEEINREEESLRPLTDEELQAKTAEFRERLAKGASVDDLLVEAYAVVKSACRRLQGKDVHVSGYDQKWDMVPYDVQLIGAIAMHHGAISEMQTGEGKTLTAVMPLYLNALTQKPVHLVTVNDYLASRDCQWVGEVLRWLGITTGVLTNDGSPYDRKSIYEADVVYGTASEFGFDYLRDNSMAQHKEEQVQRGYYFAIIDEVDSILIDEARTPLIISGPVPESRQMYDALQGGVAHLVKLQRNHCNVLASEARKTLENLGISGENTPQLTKEQQKAAKEAYHKLWLVKKGTPHNKVLKRLLENPDVRATVDEWDLYYYSEEGKGERGKALAELLLTIEERSSEYELTDKGTLEWEKKVEEGSSDDFIMLDLSDELLKIDENPDLSDEEKLKARAEIQEEDARRKERAHNLRQLLRAHLLMEKDVDYIIQDNKVVIIDENTGRPQPGRRFSDGLHQAIEAKEAVEIQKETQTYATITLQNFFRMYEKLSGMTGTALTEAQEFKEIYKLEALEIPTHRPCVREDKNDEVYMTEREKYTAILREIEEVHKKGRPILIGTESVEVSEKLSRILRQHKLTHTVLNARHHGSEAAVVAEAGQRNAITISTNMAGRGTDIKLGEGVAALGGLHVVATTRHQSRRIDRQLRGRCARQGDPGTSRFFVSFEDSLLRLFASPTVTGMLQRFRPPEGEAISAPILNRSIQTAQKRVEQRNYSIRKHTLEYDDVMNKQRQEIYSFRNETLHTDNPQSLIIEILEGICAYEAERFFQSREYEEGWNPEGYRLSLMENFPVAFEEGFFDDDHSEIEELEKKACTYLVKAFEDKMTADRGMLAAILQELKIPEETLVEDPLSAALRNIIISHVDRHWKEHLLIMDYLRSEVNLRAVAQRDPLQEFKHEAFALFDKLSHQVRLEIARAVFKFRMRHQVSLQQEAPTPQANIQMETDRSLVDELDASTPSQVTYNGSESNGDQAPQKTEPLTADPKVGRNDPCPCGSGKKYKKCCGRELSKQA